GKSIRQEFSASFLCAVPCPQPPTVDGDLSEWQVAAAFHLDREEFSNGTFVGRWTPDDLSASVYLMWDKNNLYVGARVKDQTFNQNYSGESVWMQDSIQLALAPGLDGPTYEFGLALTPTGEQIVQWLPDIKQVTKGTLKVLLESGQQTYEAAIPWSAMPKIGPVKEGIRLRYSLLVNDDDVLVGRRYLESPGGGIAHDKSLENFMEIVLLGQ
ncbi:MAG TPA: sugar-binding protein, partial [bacterium]|nr:sugar-binding protein [bacterium]